LCFYLLIFIYYLLLLYIFFYFYGRSCRPSTNAALGGCPYSHGASGNLATEDLVAMLHGMGIETGIDLEKLMDCSLFMEAQLGRELPSRHLKAVRCAKPTS